jgi:hypothetical protein
LARYAFSPGKSPLIRSSGKQLAAKRPQLDEGIFRSIGGLKLPLVSQPTALRNCTVLDDVFIYPTSTLLFRGRSGSFVGLSVVALRFSTG